MMNHPSRIMSLFLGIYAIVFSTLSFAMPDDTYDVNTKLYSDGKLIASKNIITDLDQKAIFNDIKNKENGFQLSIKVSEIYKEGNNVRPITIKYEIAYWKGNEKMKASPLIKTYANQVVSINFRAKNGRIYELKTLAKKV